MVKQNIFHGKDEDLRNELEIHLTMLKRQGIITTWHDRRIVAGSEIDSTISQNLESAKVILLLVSPYFLASDYCYDREMARALQKHDAGEARVIPVILHPCDWHSAPFGKLLATPTDGKAVSLFANQHEAFAAVTKDIRRAVESFGLSRPAQEGQPVISIPSAVSAAHAAPRSSNLRVKRAFSDHEKDEFLETSFEYIARYFEGSLSEIEQRNAQIQVKFRKLSNSRFTAAIYANGVRASSCTIWLGRESHFSKGIFYSASETTSENSFNDCMNAEDDGYTLHLNAMGMSFSPIQKDHLSQEGAAEYYWTMLVESLQR